MAPASSRCLRAASPVKGGNTSGITGKMPVPHFFNRLLGPTLACSIQLQVVAVVGGDQGTYSGHAIDVSRIREPRPSDPPF